MADVVEAVVEVAVAGAAATTKTVEEEEEEEKEEEVVEDDVVEEEEVVEDEGKLAFKETSFENGRFLAFCDGALNLETRTFLM